MKVVVTGAAGFIGSHLAERFAKAGHDVVGIDSFNTYYEPSLKRANAAHVTSAGAKIVEVDLFEADLKPTLAGADVVYHLAAQPGIDAKVPLEQYVRNNIFATHKLLEQLDKSKKPLVVNVATSSVYGAHATDTENTPPKPTSYYGVTKLAAEQLVLAYNRDRGLPACSLRLFSVYGPRERPDKLYPKLIKALCENSEFPLFEGSERHARSFTYVGDVIDAMVSIPDRREKVLGEIFNIGSDAEHTTGEAIKAVESIFGTPAKIAVKPKRPGDQTRTSANIDKARSVLGYNPKTDLRTGLEAAVKWYKSEIDGKF
jgi:nucleoside-diphosphate-sugar epimerase